MGGFPCFFQKSKERKIRGYERCHITSPKNYCHPPETFKEPRKGQDKFDHDKGQKSAISGRRLYWRLSTGFFATFSSMYVQFSKTSPLKAGESSEKSSGENRVKSCHVCGCHGFFGPEKPKGGFSKAKAMPKKTKTTKGYGTQQYIWGSERHGQERCAFLQKPPSRSPLFLVPEIYAVNCKLVLEYLRYAVTIFGSETIMCLFQHFWVGNYCRDQNYSGSGNMFPGNIF